MSALNILPPSAPGGAQKRPGFFARLFGHKELPPAPKKDTPTFKEEDFDLEEIRRKLGIDENIPAPSQPETTTQKPEPQPYNEPVGQEPVRIDPEPQRESFGLDDLPELPAHEMSEWADEEPKAKEAAVTTEWDSPIDERVIDEKEWSAEPLSEKDSSPAKSSQTNEPTEWAIQEQKTIEKKIEENPKNEERATTKQEVSQEASLSLEEFAKLASAHFTQMESEHKQLEKELRALVKEQPPELPPAEHPLDSPAPEGQEFILKNGQPLRNIRELLAALEVIDQEVFYHHVNQERNDFANWLRHVFHDEELANDVMKVRSRKELLKVLKAHAKNADKRFKDEERQLDSEVKRRKEKLASAVKLHGKLAELKADLARKSEELANQRDMLHGEVARRIAAEVARRVKDERKRLIDAQREAAQMKAEYERRLRVVSGSLDKREERIAMKEESLRKLEATLQEERARLKKEREEAEPVIAEARDVKAQLEALAAERKAIAEEKERLVVEKRSLSLREANLTKREKAVQATQDSLSAREANIARKEAALQRRQEEFLQLKRGIDEKERQLREEEKRAAQMEKRAREEEKKLISQLRERRKIARYIEDAEKKIIRSQSSMAESSAPPLINDLPPPQSVKNLKIYATIDKARQALGRGEVAEARELYNKVREMFNKERLSPQEKSVLYTTIRDLYDDINRAGLKGK